MLAWAGQGLATLERGLERGEVGLEATGLGGFTALSQAAWEGETRIVEALLGASADKDATTSDGSTSLFVAAKQGHLEVVVALLVAGANMFAATKDGTTPLATAAQKGHAEIVEVLLAAGADKGAVAVTPTAGSLAAVVAAEDDTTSECNQQ